MAQPALRCTTVLLALAAIPPGATARDRCDPPQLPQQVRQGELVLGCAPGAGRVDVDGRPVRVAPDGRFVFGVARDQSGPLRITLHAPEGPRTVDLEVEARDWRIERVDGLPRQTVTPDPEIAARIAREQAAVGRARERDDPRLDFADGFTQPVQGRISGVYGSQRILNGEPRSPHYGLDIAAPDGTPVHAPAAGVVSFSDQLYLTGGTLLIDHGHGLSSSYLHLSRIDVEAGQRVERGERIGAVGATGRASGPHLHWGMNWFEVRIDPALLPAPPDQPTGESGASPQP